MRCWGPLPTLSTNGPVKGVAERIAWYTAAGPRCASGPEADSGGATAFGGAAGVWGAHRVWIGAWVGGSFGLEVYA